LRLAELMYELIAVECGPPNNDNEPVDVFQMPLTPRVYQLL